MTSAAATIDRDNPWPGLASYDEQAQAYFSGRSAETTELVRRICDETVTVLFGKSGLGKSSLLKAGVFPVLRQRGLLPVPVRLQFGSDAADGVEQIASALFAAFDAEQIEYPRRAAGETLWDYLHRAGLRFWTAKVRPVQPVLVLDQFEEVFTLGRSKPGVADALRERLADLSENRIPATLTARAEAGDAAAAALDVHARPYKIVYSLREDFLPDLEGWVASMPSLRRNRMRLLPLQRDQALQAVCNARTEHLVDAALARRMVDYLASGAATHEAEGDTPPDAAVEPALLSLVCRGINEARKREGKERFDEALFEAGKGRIVADFYRESLADQPEALCAFIEDELVTDQGFRNSYSVAQAIASGKATREQIMLLVERRLLRIEQHLGAERVELTHDLLTVPALAGRKARAEARWAQRADRARLRWIRAAVVMVVVCLGLLYLLNEARVQAARAEELSLVARSREIAARAQAEKGSDRELAVLLGAEALRISDTPEAREALLDAARYVWPTTVLGRERLGGSPRLVGLDARGRQLVVVADADGQATLSLWDLSTRAPEKARWQRVFDKASIEFTAFTPGDAPQLLVGRPGRVEQLDVQTGEPAGPAISLPSSAGEQAPSQLVVSVDGNWLAAALPSGVVLVRDRRDPTGAWETASEEGAEAIAIADDGQRVTLVADGPLRAAVAERNRTGSWSSPRKIDMTECAAPRSVSPAASYAVATWRAQFCSRWLDRESPVDVPDRRRRKGEGDDAAVADTVASAFGPAFVAVLLNLDLRVATGNPAQPVSESEVKGVREDARLVPDGNLTSQVSVNASGTRIAWLSTDEVRVVSLAGYKPLLTEFPGGMIDSEDGHRIVQARAVARGGAVIWMTDITALFDGSELPNPRGKLIRLPRLPVRLVVRGNTVVVAALTDEVKPKLTTTLYDLDTLNVRAGPLTGDWQEVGRDGRLILVNPEETARDEAKLVRLADGRVLDRWQVDGEQSVQLSPGGTALLVVGPADTTPRTLTAQAYALRGEQFVPAGRLVDIPLAARWVWFKIDDAALAVAAARPVTAPAPGQGSYEVLHWPLVIGRETSASDPAASTKRLADRDTSARDSPATPDLEVASPKGQFVWRQSRSGSALSTVLTRREGGAELLSFGPRDVAKPNFSNDERWLAFVEDWQSRGRRGSLQVLDLHSLKPVLTWRDLRVSDTKFTRDGNLLRIKLANDSALLVPMDKALLDRFARWLVPATTRELTADDRCRQGLDSKSCNAAALKSGHKLDEARPR